MGATIEIELPTLAHLYTPIKFAAPPPQDPPDEGAQMDSSSRRLFSQLIECLHPTPALGTLPRAGGMELLRKMQADSGQIRNRFGAPLGAIFPTGKMVCFVAIRNIEWGAQKSQIGAGCGLVSASQLEREWEEVLGKVRSTKKALGLK